MDIKNKAGAGTNELKCYLAENLNDMNRTVDNMLKLVGENDDDLGGKKSELISYVIGFKQMYDALVENCSHLTEELLKPAPSKLHLEVSDYLEASIGLETPFFTPNQKLNSNISGGGRSAPCFKQTTEVSSSSYSDSEADSTNSSVNSDHSPPVNTTTDELPLASDGLITGFSSMKEQHQMAGIDKPNNILSEGNETKYEEFLKISVDNEELRDIKLKLEITENEVCRLRDELEKCEPAFKHAKNLEKQLEIVKMDLEMKKTDLDLENRKVYDLQKQTAELETHVVDCCNKISKLLDELEIARESRNRSEAVIMGLHIEADSNQKQILDLNELIAWYEARLAELDIEFQTLKITMSAKQEQYSFEKEQLESENSTLSEEVLVLNSKINDLESRSRAFEQKLVQCVREKLEMAESKITQETVLQDEMNHLRKELHERRYQVECLNNEFDTHKQKYDMLMVESDELKVSNHKLLIDVGRRDDKILDLGRQLLQLHVEWDGLRYEVDELQKELASKRVEISDGAEAKREAIRQLCLTLDYYRTCYQEHRQAVTSNQRHV